METDSKPQPLDEVAQILHGIAHSVAHLPLSDYLLSKMVEELDKAHALLQEMLDERSRDG